MNWIQEDSHETTRERVKVFFQHYQKLQIGEWKVYKSYRSCDIYTQEVDQKFGMKGIITVAHPFEEIVQFLSDGGEDQVQMQLQTSNTLMNVDGLLKVIETTSRITQKSTNYTIIEQNQRFTHLDDCQKNFFVFKGAKYISEVQTSNIKLCMIKLIDAIHVMKNEQDQTKCQVQSIVVFNRDKNFKAFRKLVKEQISNLVSINQELKPFNAITLQFQAMEQQQQTQTFMNPFEESKQQPDDESNDIIYLNYNDREDVDHTVDASHPAAIYAQMHDRKLTLTVQQIIHMIKQEQQSVFESFKQRICAIYKVRDNTLIRYLIARNYNIEESTELLVNCIKWRKANDVNSRRMKDYPIFIEQKLHMIIGQDKWGHPILYNDCGKARPERFGNGDFTVDNYLKFNQAFLEEACLLMKVIIDCYKASRKNLPPSVIKDQFKQFFQYYACRPYKNVIINANFLVQSIFTLIRPMLPKRTLERLVFIGQDNAKIRQALLNEMTIDQLPRRYGGNNALIE